MFSHSVSVVIPAYNSELYIGAALDSVLAQNHSVNEIIVVDDGSTDSTQSVVARYPGVKWIQQDHRGPSAARNSGILAAKSEWVAFLDSDDLWHPEKMEKQINALANFSSAMFGFSTIEGFYTRGDGIVIEMPFMPEALCKWAAENQTFQESVFGDAYRLLLETNCVHTSSVVARREALLEVGQFDVSLNHGEDHDLWLRLSRRWPAVFNLKPISQYRIHARSISGDSRGRQDIFFRSTIQVLSKHLRLFPSLIVRRALTNHYNDYAVFLLKKKKFSGATAAAVSSILTMPTTRGLRLWLEATFPNTYSRVGKIVMGGRGS